MSKIVIRPLTVAGMGDYLAFFDSTAFTDNPRWAGCYCYFPFHDPRTTEWQRRTGPENREAICSRIAAGLAQGYLAYLGAEVVGWCNAGRHALYPMLQDDSEADAESVGVIFCFVVAPEHRGKGVATRLLAAACDGLRAQGLKLAQATPRKDAAGAAANHLGPLAMYLDAGFTILREDAEGNVFVQKTLA